MTNPPALLRSLLVWALVLPVAIILGYNINDLADLRYTSFPIFGMLVLVLMAPLLLRYHHAWLLAAWNVSAVIFFLPGRPQLWMGMAGLSLLITVLQTAINPEKKVLSVPAVNWPLIALAAVALLTAKLTGGMGLASLGSDVYGGKRYFWIWAAIVGYFAISSRPIPRDRAPLYVALFFLGGVTMAIGNLFGIISPTFNWIFLIFPVESLQGIDTADGLYIRSWALPFMSIGVFCAMLSRYGLRGIFDIKHPWRLLVILAFGFVGMLGGFRSMVVLLLLTVGLLFFMEDLLRSKLMPIAILSIILTAALVAAFAQHLPLSVQRSLAVLPIEVDPIVRWDTQGSSEWRIRMWKELLPQVPQHLLIGKGYAIAANDIEILMTSLRNPSADATSGAQMVADYHNGPLSVILPLGLPGAFAFLWFLIAGYRVLRRNYKHGDPELQKINRFLFAFYVAKIIFFMSVFGSLYSDIATFAGLVGLSVSLNNGVAKPAPAPVRVPEVRGFKFDPARRRALPV